MRYVVIVFTPLAYNVTTKQEYETTLIAQKQKFEEPNNVN